MPCGIGQSRSRGARRNSPSRCRESSTACRSSIAATDGRIRWRFAGASSGRTSSGKRSSPSQTGLMSGCAAGEAAMRRSLIHATSGISSSALCNSAACRTGGGSSSVDSDRNPCRSAGPSNRAPTSPPQAARACSWVRNRTGRLRKPSRTRSTRAAVDARSAPGTGRNSKENVTTAARRTSTCTRSWPSPRWRQKTSRIRPTKSLRTFPASRIAPRACRRPRGSQVDSGRSRDATSVAAVRSTRSRRSSPSSRGPACRR